MFALKAKQVVDGTGAVIPNGIVLVDGGRISAVGVLGEVSVPSGTEVIDCGTDSVLPGLVDSHVHLALNTTKAMSVIEQHTAPLPLMAIRAVSAIQKDIRAGVTTMRALGEPHHLDLVVRDAVNDGELPGPRILACGHAIRPSHGTAFGTAIPADGPDEVRRVVRQAIALGADVIKLFVSNISRGQTPLAYRQGDLTRVPAFSKPEIEAAVNEAHTSGLRVAAHAIGGPALRWALEAGVDSIEHANLMDEADIELFLEKGAWLSDPNLQLFFDDETGFKAPAKSAIASPEWFRKVEESAEVTRRVHRLAIEAGVKYSLATDSNRGLLWKEAKHMVEVLGCDTMAAIVSITKTNAELLGLGDEIGTIAEGKRADLIVVKGNPLEDITNLRNISTVYKDGLAYQGI